MSRYNSDGYRSSKRITALGDQKGTCDAQYYDSLLEPEDYEEYMNPNGATTKDYFMRKCKEAQQRNMRGGRKSRRTKRRGTKRTKRTRRRRR